jgi:DNA-binding transcriptional MerR regulator
MSEELNYTIAEVSERLKLSYRTLHYYEQYFGIPVNRDVGGNRVYTEENISVLEKIVDLKLKDMTLKGIKKLLQDNELLPLTNNLEMIVVDDKALEFKEFLLNEIREVISEEIQAANSKLDAVLRDNEELREELRKMSRQSEEHYSKIDVQLSAWRNRQPWYKKIFKKE